MTFLSSAERKRVADYLEQLAIDDERMARQLRDAGHGAMSARFRQEALAERIVSEKLRRTESVTV